MMRVHTHTRTHGRPPRVHPTSDDLSCRVHHLSRFKVRHGMRIQKNTRDKYQLTGSPLSSRPALTFVCVCVFVCLCVCVFVCSWRYFLTHSNSLLPSALSSSADLCVILFSRFADQRDSSELFTLYFVFRGAGSRFCCLCNKSDNWKPNCGWNFNSVSFSLQELLLL